MRKDYIHITRYFGSGSMSFLFDNRATLKNIMLPQGDGCVRVGVIDESRHVICEISGWLPDLIDFFDTIYIHFVAMEREFQEANAERIGLSTANEPGGTERDSSTVE